MVSSSAPNVLSVSSHDEPTSKVEITLDPTSSLPAKLTTISLSDPDHPTASETRFEQWEAFGGVKFPQRITIFHGAAKLAEITAEQTVVNRGIQRDALAAKPQDLKPVMSAPAW